MNHWSLVDLAFYVCGTLDRAGHTVVLCGGGAASYYAPESMQSRDLDFVIPFAMQSLPVQLIHEMGFKATRSAGTYSHPNSAFTLEFLDGPIQIDDEVVTEWNTVLRGTDTLHVISPLDCVKDRLAAAIHWHDMASISQAAAVLSATEVAVADVEQWCLARGKEGRRVYDRLAALV